MFYGRSLPPFFFDHDWNRRTSRCLTIDAAPNGIRTVAEHMEVVSRKLTAQLFESFSLHSPQDLFKNSRSKILPNYLVDVIRNKLNGSVANQTINPANMT
jgi:hypothetical protein